MPAAPARALAVLPGSPALRIARHYIGEDGTVVEATINYLRARSFTYSMRLKRETSAGRR